VRRRRDGGGRLRRRGEAGRGDDTVADDGLTEHATNRGAPPSVLNPSNQRMVGATSTLPLGRRFPARPTTKTGTGGHQRVVHVRRPRGAVLALAGARSEPSAQIKPDVPRKLVRLCVGASSGRDMTTSGASGELRYTDARSNAPSAGARVNTDAGPIMVCTWAANRRQTAAFVAANVEEYRTAVVDQQ